MKYAQTIGRRSCRKSTGLYSRFMAVCHCPGVSWLHGFVLYSTVDCHKALGSKSLNERRDMCRVRLRERLYIDERN